MTSSLACKVIWLDFFSRNWQANQYLLLWPTCQSCGTVGFVQQTRKLVVSVAQLSSHKNVRSLPWRIQQEPSPCLLKILDETDHCWQDTDLEICAGKRRSVGSGIPKFTATWFLDKVLLWTASIAKSKFSWLQLPPAPRVIFRTYVRTITWTKNFMYMDTETTEIS